MLPKTYLTLLHCHAPALIGLLRNHIFFTMQPHPLPRNWSLFHQNVCLGNFQEKNLVTKFKWKNEKKRCHKIQRKKLNYSKIPNSWKNHYKNHWNFAYIYNIIWDVFYWLKLSTIFSRSHNHHKILAIFWSFV
jgi:hypothetical protein